MLNSKTIISKFIRVSVAMVVFFGLTAQSGERNTSKVKKLYEKKEAEKNIAFIRENMELTEVEVTNRAKMACNEEIAKESGGGFMITKEPINVIIDKCARQKKPEIWRQKDEIKREKMELIKELEELLTLKGCRKAAEEDEDCTDDLIVKFDRFGTCVCETY